MKRNTIIISLCFLITGFLAAYFIFGYRADHISYFDSNSELNSDITSSIANPFSVKKDIESGDTRVDHLEREVRLIKQQLQQIELSLEELTSTATTASVESRSATSNNNRFASALTQRLYNLDNLIKGGIDPSLAEDIVRRKNSIELKRLALQDRATREGYLDTQQYYDELAAINVNDISLRQELGDQRYDEYLYNSKQNNRIRISSVMLGSAAEQAGIQDGDIVLSYDNTRMFNWSELKDATAEGQLGEYVSISIYRNGEIFSFSVPRGPLGMQLGATRLEP
jgi:membrane-associated protease RseP (regulator of RpoE activity)